MLTLYVDNYLIRYIPLCFQVITKMGKEIAVEYDNQEESDSEKKRPRRSTRSTSHKCVEYSSKSSMFKVIDEYGRPAWCYVAPVTGAVVKCRSKGLPMLAASTRGIYVNLKLQTPTFIKVEASMAFVSVAKDKIPSVGPSRVVPNGNTRGTLKLEGEVTREEQSAVSQAFYGMSNRHGDARTESRDRKLMTIPSKVFKSQTRRHTIDPDSEIRQGRPAPMDLCVKMKMNVNDFIPIGLDNPNLGLSSDQELYLVIIVQPKAGMRSGHLEAPSMKSNKVRILMNKPRRTRNRCGLKTGRRGAFRSGM